MADLTLRSALDRPLTSIEADGNITELAARIATNAGAIETQGTAIGSLETGLGTAQSDIATLQGEVETIGGSQNNTTKWMANVWPFTGVPNPLTVANYLNDYEQFTVTPTESRVFYRFLVQLQFPDETTKSYYYLFDFGGGKGKWGFNPGGAPDVFPVQASKVRLLALYPVVPNDIEQDADATIVPLGEIEEGGFLAAANVEEHDFTATDTQFYFSYYIGEVLYLALFIGTPGIYGGGGMDVDDFTDADFAQVTNSTVTAVPGLQDVLNAESEATVSTNVRISHGSEETLSSVTLSDAVVAFQAGENVFTMGDESAEINSNLSILPSVNDNDAVQRQEVVVMMSESSIPLTGTVEGFSVTGDIEIDPDVLFKIKQSNSAGEKAVTFYDDITMSVGIDLTSGYERKLLIDSTEMKIRDTDPLSPGLRGEQDFTENIDYLDYTQKKYVDDLAATKADLDGNGKVPLSQMNDAVLGNVHYKGIYNGTVISSSTDSALNGTALPAAASGNSGWYFISSGAYTNGGESYNTGDWIISSGSSWSKVDNTDAVMTVNGMTGNVVIAMGDISGLVSALAGKQATLVSGTNIKTVDGQSLLGSGNIDLSGFPKIIKCDPVTSSAVTTLTPTITGSYLIPAGTLSNGVLKIAAKMQKVNQNAAFTVKFSINTTNSLSGATDIAVYTSASNTRYAPMERDFTVKGNTLFGLNNAGSAIVENAVTGTPTATTYTVASAYYLIVSVTLASTSDSVTQESFEMTFKKAV